MKILVALIAMSLFQVGAAYAGCASSVTEARQSGVLKQFLRFTDDASTLSLVRVSDGKRISAGVRGGQFQVAGIGVDEVCVNGNTMTASKKWGEFTIRGKVRRTGRKGNRRYNVNLNARRLQSYNGTYRRAN